MKKVTCQIANFIDGLLYCSWMEVHDDIYSIRYNDSKYYRIDIHYLAKDCGIVHVKNNKLSLRRKIGIFRFNCIKDHCLVPIDIAKLMVKKQSFDIHEYHKWWNKKFKRNPYKKDVVKCIGKFYKTSWGKE